MRNRYATSPELLYKGRAVVVMDGDDFGWYRAIIVGHEGSVYEVSVLCREIISKSS